jgi:hypothetical protein
MDDIQTSRRFGEGQPWNCQATLQQSGVVVESA